MTAPNANFTAAVTAATADLTRRAFVVQGSCALAALSVLGACSSLVVHQIQPVNGRLAMPLASYPELREPNGAVRVSVPGAHTPIYVLRLSEREFAALSPICTHLGCTVEMQGRQLVCPCHGSTYERNGALVRGPAERPLTRYTTSLAYPAGTDQAIATGTLLITLDVAGTNG